MVKERDPSIWPADLRDVAEERLRRLERIHPFSHDRSIEFVGTGNNHFYRVGGQKLEGSVTSFVKGPFEKFDTQKSIRTMRDSTRQEKYAGMSDEEIALKWDKDNSAANKLGQKVHRAMEIYANIGELSSDCTISKEMAMGKDFMQFVETSGEEVWRTELCMFFDGFAFGNKISIAGSADLITRNKETGRFSIFDYKRSKEIKTDVGWKYGFGKGSDLMTELADVNFIHYSLQLHLYRWILETAYGLWIDPDSLFIVVLHSDNDRFKCIQAKDLSEHIKEMLGRFGSVMERVRQQRKIDEKNFEYLLGCAEAVASV